MTDGKPCTETGHEFGPWELWGYHTAGVPHLHHREGFDVRRYEIRECQKCTRTEKRKKRVGKVHVDPETDELRVEDDDGM